MDANKAPLFKTARVVLACAGFPAGEFVAVEFLRVADNGVVWFDVKRGDRETCLPASQLTDFVL